LRPDQVGRRAAAFRLSRKGRSSSTLFLETRSLSRADENFLLARCSAASMRRSIRLRNAAFMRAANNPVLRPLEHAQSLRIGVHQQLASLKNEKWGRPSDLPHLVI